jgi:hypothetical protein
VLGYAYGYELDYRLVRRTYAPATSIPLIIATIAVSGWCSVRRTALS